VQNGCTALHAFAEYDCEMVETVLEKGASFSAKDNRSTPLHVAAFSGPADIVRALCRFLAKDGESTLRSQLCLVDNVGTTPLHRAIEAGNIDAAKVLVDEFGDNLLTPCNGDSALHLAALSGEAEFISFIAGRCPTMDPNAQTHSTHRTALHISAYQGHGSFTKTLLATFENINPLLQDSDGHTALSIAASQGRVEVVELLKDAGPDIPCPAGFLPFHYAVGG